MSASESTLSAFEIFQAAGEEPQLLFVGRPVEGKRPEAVPEPFGVLFRVAAEPLPNHRIIRQGDLRAKGVAADVPAFALEQLGCRAVVEDKAAVRVASHKMREGGGSRESIGRNPAESWMSVAVRRLVLAGEFAQVPAVDEDADAG